MIISRIPQLVQNSNLSLAELSRRSGLSHKTVVKLYYADFTCIHIDALDRLCEALNASPGDLFKHTPGNRSSRPVLEALPERTHPMNKRAKHAVMARRTDA